MDFNTVFYIVHVFNTFNIDSHLNYVQKFICTPRITIYISFMHTGRLIKFRGTISIYYVNYRCHIKTFRLLNSELLMLQQVALSLTLQKALAPKKKEEDLMDACYISVIFVRDHN